MKKTFLFAFLTVLFVSNVAWTEQVEPRRPSRTPDIHYVPTPHEVVEIMLRLADVSEDDLVYDLGSGDGRIVIAAAKKAGCRTIGYEIDPAMVERALENVEKSGVGDLVEIIEADIFELDISDASVITLYLLPELNVRLIPQLETLKPGSRIVSHNFDMAGVKPDVIARIGDFNKVYLWTTPLRKTDVDDHGAR